MRFRVHVVVDDALIPWPDLHGPARGVLYTLLRSQDPELSAELHDKGWAGQSIKPIGISPPLFFSRKGDKEGLRIAGSGSIWVGSPVPRIASCLLAALAGCTEIRWGGARLTVRGVQLDPAPPSCESGVADFSAISPILIKKDGRYLLPDEPEYVERLTHNLRHRADVLGLSSDVKVEVLDVGPRRLHDVQGKPRVGATATLRIQAAPESLQAFYDSGIGLNCVEGFGWLR